MFRLNAIILSLFLAIAPAFAQVGQIPSWPPIQVVASGAAYTGPLDVISGAKLIVSVRCASTSYTGNVMDVWDAATGSTTETLITCSSGGVLNTSTPSTLATTCASGCAVKTWYDQSGSLACVGGTACNFTQATNANRPTLLNFATPATWQISFVQASSLWLGQTAAFSAVTTAPYPITIVAERTNATSGGRAFTQGGSTLQLTGRSVVANGWDINTGSAVDFVASDSTLHSVQFNAANGTSSTTVVDGTANTVSMGSTSLNTTGLFIGSDNLGVSPYWQGNVDEFALYPTGTWTSTQYGNMCHNQRLYFGTPGSC